MASYRYLAEEASGQRVDGHVEASSVEEARQLLEEKELRILEIIQADSASPPPPPVERLSRDETQELVESVAQLSAAELPLAPAFHAAAAESDSPRLARVFDALAAEIERGHTLEEALESSHSALPKHVTRMVRAAIRTGQLGPALTELVEYYRDAGTLRQSIRDGMTYPLLVFVLATILLCFIFAGVIGQFGQIFEEFGVELPALTLALLSFRAFGWVIVPATILLLAILAVLVRNSLGRSGWHRLLSSAPVVGPLWHWLALMEWLGLVRVLLRNGMTLLDALRASADGVSNANVSQIAEGLADGVARGRSLSQAMVAQRQLPGTLVPLIHWGEEAGALDDSLELGCEMLEDRIRMRAFWLHVALPPILFIFIGCTILTVVCALFLPLIKLLSCLM